MYGFPASSRYAPTPKLIFLGDVLALKASVMPEGGISHDSQKICTQHEPRIGSGGPAGTPAHEERKILGTLLETMVEAKRALSIVNGDFQL